MIPWAQESVGDQLENVVGAVAEDNLIPLNAISRAEHTFELVATAIGIAGNLANGVFDGLPHFRTRASRILVRRELDDVCFHEPILASKLANRLAGHVGREAADVFWRESSQFGDCSHSFCSNG